MRYFSFPAIHLRKTVKWSLCWRRSLYICDHHINLTMCSHQHSNQRLGFVLPAILIVLHVCFMDTLLFCRFHKLQPNYQRICFVCSVFYLATCMDHSSTNPKLMSWDFQLVLLVNRLSVSIKTRKA